jgi:hypothetical protein
MEVSSAALEALKVTVSAARELTVGGGQVWTVFATSSASDTQVPQDYALATFAFGDAFILTGSGTVEEFAELAGALTASIAQVTP